MEVKSKILISSGQTEQLVDSNTRRFMKVDFPEPYPGYPKTQVYIGPTESGKSRFAHEQAAGKKVTWLYARGFRIAAAPFFFQKVTSDTELLVIDDLPCKKLKSLLELLFDPNLYIQRRKEEPFSISRPRTIITCDCEILPVELLAASYARRFEYVKFPEAAPEHWGVVADQQ